MGERDGVSKGGTFREENSRSSLGLTFKLSKKSRSSSSKVSSPHPERSAM